MGVFVIACVHIYIYGAWLYPYRRWLQTADVDIVVLVIGLCQSSIVSISLKTGSTCEERRG